MKKFYVRFPAFVLLLLMCFLFASAAFPDTSHAAEYDEKSLIEAARAMRASGTVQFNFTDLELVTFVRFLSELMQRTIVVPPNISGTITVISPKPSSISEARQIFISILQSQGWSLQNMGAYDKLVQGTVSTPSDVSSGRGLPEQGEEFISQIIPLRYIVADFVAQTIQQAFGQSVIVLPAGNGRDILLQGRATDVRRGMEIIRGLDVESSAPQSRVFTLKYADPALAANQLNAIAQQGTHLRGLSAVPDPNSRQVVVVGETRAIDNAAKIIEQLDIDSRESEFHIYKLQNIDATEASEQLSKVLAASAMTQAGQAGGTAVPANVVPDLTTNSLIFTATQRQFDSLAKILETIDVQPKQVLIRGFMAEVNITNLDKAGIDWSILGGQIWDNLMLGGVGQLGETAVPSQFVQYFNELSRTEELVERGGSTYTVTNYEPLALLYATVEMLKKYDAINVLSVPRLMCTDNKESSFQVGQVIPMLSNTASDLANPNALQQSYNYKDTGLTLTVTPHIRSGNVVALDIEQTTEDVLTAMGSTTPVTAKRQVKTSVTVQDGETIILGGMVKETERSLRRRVPGLSYIPLIGSLFQKVSKEREKVDFIIFLTPQIIGNNEQMREATGQAALIPGDAEQLRREMSPAEAEVDRRFKELYQNSSKR